MHAIGGARDDRFVIGPKPPTLRSLDVEIEQAIEQVAELNVG